MRLLEMPADGLVVLGGVADLRLDPVGEARVQLGARALEQAPIGGVADQHVVEAQHRLAEEPAACRARSARCAAAPRAARRARCRCATAARPRRCARSGGRRPRRARARCAPRDAGARCARRAARGSSAASRARRGRRRRSSARPARSRAPSCDQHAHQLADEERIALAGGEHLGGDGRGQIGGADDVGGEAHRGAGVEAGERHDVGDQPARRRQRGAQLAQLGPRADQHEQRHAAAPLHQVLDQIEQQRLGPVQVVDHQHHRLAPARARRGSGGRRRRSPPARRASRRAARRCRRRCARGRRSSGSARSSADRSRRIASARSDPSIGARATARSASASGANVAPPAASQCAVITRRRVAEPARELVDQARLAEPRRAEHARRAAPPARRPPRRRRR